MSILIAYYSAGGNTKEIASRIIEKIGSGAECTRIEPVHEYTNIFSRYLLGTLRAKRGIKSPIKEAKTDLEPYNLLLVGFPIWSGKLPPPVITYIDSLTNCGGKKAATFISSHWGFESYHKIGHKELQGKGLEILGSLSFKARRVEESELNKVLDIIKKI